MKIHITLFIFLFLNIWSFAQVTVQTNIPSSIAPNSEFLAEVKINKGTIGGFTRYQMDVPEGVTISEGDSKGGNFTFEDKRMKIIWHSVPATPEIVISFKIIGSTSGSSVLHHKFSYVEAGSKKEADFEPINVKFDPSAGPSIVSNPKTEEPKHTEPVKTEPEKNVTPDPKTTNPKTESSAKAGVVYKVQIGAFEADPKKDYYKNVTDKLVIVKEEGFFKVLVGNFATKEEAVNKLNSLKNSGYQGFVATYQNGTRVK